MIQRALPALAMLIFAGCGAKYAAGGSCTRDDDCLLCVPCGCEQAYAKADVGSADCPAIEKAASCSSQPDRCLTGSRQALCVSGQCQAVSR